jgi:sporulation protein YtfJ
MKIDNINSEVIKMNDHPIQGLMKTAMENLKEMVDVNTIIGDPVETPDGSVILTVSKVGFGFAAGGSDFNLDTRDFSNNESMKNPFGGGSGGGVSILPIAFLIVNSSGVNLVHLNEGTHILEKLIDILPQGIDKVKQMISNNSSTKSEDKIEDIEF